MLWKLIKGMAKSALSQNKPLLFCGELAKNPKCIEKLITLGVTTISASPKVIPEVKNKVINIYDKEHKAMNKEVALKKEFYVI